jgi:hypothetical protein
MLGMRPPQSVASIVVADATNRQRSVNECLTRLESHLTSGLNLFSSDVVV